MPDKKLNILQKISKLIIGEPSNFKNNIDTSINNIKTYSAPYSYDTFISLINAMKQQDENFIGNEDLKKIVESTVSKQTYTNQQRIQKYNDVVAIKKKIGYAHRALKVITNNILKPDFFNPKIFIIDFDDNDNIEKVISNKFNNINKHFQLESKVKKSIKNALLKGDYFIEIIQSREYLDTFSNHSDDTINILEEKLLFKTEKENEYTKNIEIKFEGFDQLNDIIDEQDNTLIVDEINNLMNEKESKKNNLGTTQLKMHDPKNIIKLEYDDIVIGYLVLKGEYNNLSGFTTFGAHHQDPNEILNQKDFNSQDIFKKISAKLIQLIKDKNFLNNNEDLLNMITTIIMNNPNKLDSINVRFVKESNMVHFMNITESSDIYGSSIFEEQLFNGKLLIALKTALTINRIDKSIDKNIGYIEVGLSRDARTVIEQFKESQNKKKLTLDDMGTVDSIPSKIPSYENIYIPQKNGKRFVDFGEKPANRSIQNIVDDIKMIRDEFVAALDVPPQLIGLEENMTSWENTLSQQNLFFASSILEYQIQFSLQVTELFQKIYKVANLYDTEEELVKLENILVKFQVPTTLKNRMLSDHIQVLNNIIDSISQNLNISREQIAKLFYKNILTDEQMEQLEIDSKIEKINNPNDPNADPNNNTSNNPFGAGF